VSPLVEQLLETAAALAALDQRRPRSASLRRAVSTAYYALFHSLAELCADTLVGWKQSWDVFTPIYRSLEHARTLTVLTARADPLGEQIERIGVAFRQLQEAREWADYNPEPHPDPRQTLDNIRFTREAAQELIDIARDAIEAVDALDPVLKLKLAARLIARPRKEVRR